MTVIGTRPRLLFLLSEPGTTETEDVTGRAHAESHRVLSGGSFSPAWEQVLRPIGCWCYGVHHHVRDLYLIGDVAAATGLLYASIVDTGPVGALEPTTLRTLVEQAEANLVVCGGSETVFWPLVTRLGLGSELLTAAYGQPLSCSVLETGERRAILLEFRHPALGYHMEGGHHRLFKLFLHACDAVCRKRLLD